MGFMRAVEGRTHPVDHFLGRQELRWFDDPSLAMAPRGLDWVQPRALARQGTDEDAHPATCLFDLEVVLADPTAYLLADVPGGIVPGQHQGRFPPGLELGAAPGQKLRR